MPYVHSGFNAMPTQAILSWLYLLNATVLITHQIDSAYWHEWELFRMQGGIQLNLLLNIPLIMLVLFGQQCLTQGRTAGIIFSGCSRLEDYSQSAFTPISCCRVMLPSDYQSPSDYLPLHFCFHWRRRSRCSCYATPIRICEMDKIDLKKTLKHLYNPSAKEIAVVEVPTMNFLIVDGEGDPNTSQA
jgi:hypothetical protein